MTAQFQDAKARCTPRAGFALGELDSVWPNRLIADSNTTLGHKTLDVAAELGNLIEAADKVAGQGSRKSPALVWC